MRKRRLVAWVAAPLAVGLFASACGGGGGAEAGDGIVSVNHTEPENPLVPSNTTETGGGNVLKAMFTGLVDYDEKTTEPYNAVAESIDTTDNKVFKIKLKPGWTFHDGTPVTSNSFVKAWNYAAYGPNGQSATSFFEHIQGYKDVNPGGEDGEGPPPTTKEMSGLKVVDELNFEVTLDAPFATFPVMLGYTAFSPLPESFYADPKAFEEKPVGNGPFKWDSRQPNAFIKLVKYDQYAGKNKPQINGIEFRIYNELETAYQDLVSGNLDFVDQLPPSAMVGDKWKTDLQERGESKPILSNNALQVPLYDPKYQDPKVRQALSMAIDRKQITSTVFQNTYEPATGWVVADAIPGYQPGGCGEFCEFNPEKAKQLLTEANFQGPITITSNSDGGHKEWIEAICGQFKNNLGVDCVFNPVPTFSEFLKMHKENAHNGPFRFGWLGDYPAAETFLGKVYRTGASSNYMRYDSPEFNEAMNRADQAPTEEEANKLYLEAEKILAKDMPSIPLWNQKASVGWSERLEGATVTFDRNLNFETVKLKS
ncbi:peptide ABC transporter substrate-binding protein [Saccharopolyspora antimicrobica]|uniref:Oligopeptide transport system substrate-binding protein n=2 Tax=Saccharopolyspora antimicrobica TaxID=455193 RepID=A0ABX9T928_9PSEU|nr:ABC transporter substrate-binding protein [Saccharopolyspora antimicrobica]RKT83510.1 oligopeptide transport system substrate-binding protein [Saccharopolyspora antimicrobica]